jgi:hypothetical protein
MLVHDTCPEICSKISPGITPSNFYSLPIGIPSAFV